jgi:phosphatidylserine decarboxylase
MLRHEPLRSHLLRQKKVSCTHVIPHPKPHLGQETPSMYESAFKVQLTVLDWDKLSSNDHVGDAGFMVDGGYAAVG